MQAGSAAWYGWREHTMRAQWENYEYPSTDWLEAEVSINEWAEEGEY